MSYEIAARWAYVHVHHPRASPSLHLPNHAVEHANQDMYSGQKMEIDPKDETRMPTWPTTLPADFFRSLRVEPILGRSESCHKRAAHDEAPMENKKQRTKGRKGRGWGELERVMNLPLELWLEVRQ